MDTPQAATKYKNHRFPVEIISHAVWLYFRFCLSFRKEAVRFSPSSWHCLSAREIRLTEYWWYYGLVPVKPARSAYSSDLNQQLQAVPPQCGQ
jgi:hypothetical protein